MEQKTIVIEDKLRNMTMGEIVKAYPAAIPVMLGHGLHCVGCHVSYEETLEQGAMGHGMDETDFAQMVQELKTVIEESSVNSTQALNITPRAIAKMKQLLAEHKKQGHGVRIQIVTGGCSGFSYDFDFEQAKRDGDTVVEMDGVKIYVDPNSYRMISGSKIDYVDSFQGAGFKVVNPNATGGCGCGQSFTV